MAGQQHSDDIDLVKAFVDKTDALGPYSNYTWDDFFDEFKVPKSDRTDFAIGCILKQARDKYGYGKAGV